MDYKHEVTGKLSTLPWRKDEAIAFGISRYSSEEACDECSAYPLVRYTESDECVNCAMQQAKEDWALWKMGSPSRPDPFVTTKDEAVLKRVNYYYVPILCNGGNHFIKRNIKTKKCVTCSEKTVVVSVVNDFMEKNPNMVISKEAAAILKLVVYRTGEPCRRGHKFWRYVNGGACLACLRPSTYPPAMIPRDFSIPPVPVIDQPAMFIGYAYDKGKIIGSDGKRLNPTQFDSNFDLHRFQLRNGTTTTSAFKAFKENFYDNR